MFGRLFERQSFISIVLLGFCVYMVKLFIDGKIILYIHPRYSLFSLIMCVLAVAILLVELVITIKKKRLHRNASRLGSGRTVNVLVAIVLLLAFILPAQTLSPEAIGRRSLKTPTSSGSQAAQTASPFASNNKYRACSETKPDSIDAWVNEMSQYPRSCYEGQPITLTGFVLESPDTPLPDNMYYLGRVVMSCCAIDAQPYALPIEKDSNDYQKDSWWRVSGTLRTTTVNGLEQLVVVPERASKLSSPDNPYEYINMSSASAIVPIELTQQ